MKLLLGCVVPGRVVSRYKHNSRIWLILATLEETQTETARRPGRSSLSQLLSTPDNSPIEQSKWIWCASDNGPRLPRRAGYKLISLVREGAARFGLGRVGPEAVGGTDVRRDDKKPTATLSSATIRGQVGHTFLSEPRGRNIKGDSRTAGG